MIKSYFFLIFLGLGLQINSLSAQVQESMMTDVSYVFLEKLIATAKENYPRMNGYDNKIQIAKSDISNAQVSWLDAFSFSYVYNPQRVLDASNPTFLFDGYQVAVGFNLSAILQKPGTVRQAKESLKLVHNDLEEYNLTLETEVKRRYFSYIQALNILKLQTKLTSDAMNISRDIRTRYEKSEVTFEQYTQSQMTYSGAVQSKIAAEANFLTAKATLEELITKKVEEVQ